MEREEKPIGVVTHFFPKIGVAVVKFHESVRVGEKIAIRGATTDFTQTIESMEVDHASVSEAKKGDEVGMKVLERVREGDKVFRA
jgi:putative protease